MKRIVFILFASALIISSCSDRNKFSISGTSAENKGKYIKIARVDVDTPVLIDSVKISKKGTFRFKVEAGEPDFYQLGLSSGNFITLLALPGEKIKVEFLNTEFYKNYSVKGSPGTTSLIKLDSALAVTKGKIDSLRSYYNTISASPDFKAKEEEINQRFVQLLKNQRLFNIEFILKNLRSFASIKAIYQKIDETTYVLYDSRDLQFLKLVSDTLFHYYPDSKHVRSLKNNFEKEYNQLKMNRLNELAKNLPETKLNPELTDINGRRISLSSLKGKYVLLTFWSAASRDCLAENIDFKNYYRQYRNKGFEIYQVNLDTDIEVWKKAVLYDELPWISVREDDPLNPQTAILYNVRILPANYLYDREGNIIGSNLHGKALQIRLAQLFPN